MTTNPRAPFTDLPEDDDTVTMSRTVGTVSERTVCVEYWNWEGLFGTSVIFLSAEVADLDDDGLEAEARRLLKLGPEYGCAVKRRTRRRDASPDSGPEYDFCNFVKPDES